MALWQTTEQSVQTLLQGWGLPVDEVQLVAAGHGPATPATTVDGTSVVINTDAGRLPRTMQGARVESLTRQLADPTSAARLAAVCAPLLTSTWRAVPLPEDMELAATLLLLDQSRAEAQIQRQHPVLRALLPTVATWLTRAPIAGSDDAVAYQLLSTVCPRADALVLPTTATARIKAQLVDYLGPVAMREFMSVWRALLAAPDQRSVLLDLSEQWLALAHAHLPRHQDRVSTPTLLATTAQHATNDLEAIEAAAMRRIEAQRDEANELDGALHPDTEFDPDHGLAGAGTGLPAHRALRHRAPTEADTSLRNELRSALSVAQSRQVTTIARPSHTPIGRADPRELVRMSAQRHSGTPVTAAPWTRHIPEMDAQPDILVAAVLDTSASMAPWLATAAPLMWAVSCAAHDLGGAAAVWGFGGDAFEIIQAGSAPHLVPHVIDSGSGSTGYAAAVATACDQVRLLGTGGARLLVVLTDGRLHDPEEARHLQRTVADAVASGVTVLWALTGGTAEALAPDQAIVVPGVTPGRFADTVRRVLIRTVTTS